MKQKNLKNAMIVAVALVATSVGLLAADQDQAIAALTKTKPSMPNNPPVPPVTTMPVSPEKQEEAQRIARFLGVNPQVMNTGDSQASSGAKPASEKSKSTVEKEIGP